MVPIDSKEQFIIKRVTIFSEDFDYKDPKLYRLILSYYYLLFLMVNLENLFWDFDGIQI